MEISLLKDDDLSIVTLKGKGSYEDRVKLRDYLDLLLANDALLLVVDLLGAEFLPASILGVLTQKADAFKRQGGRVMFVVDPARNFSPLVSPDHLRRFFATAASVEEASERIRIETVEEESIRALIRRAKPTPPPLPEKEPETGRNDEPPAGGVAPA